MAGTAKPTVGLDFGTSTSLVASPRGVVRIGDSWPWLSSEVGLGDDGTPVFGDDTDTLPAEQVVRSVKRAITDGRDFVRVDTPTGLRDVRVDDLVVALLREIARRSAGQGVPLTSDTVRLGCPAMWDGYQRRRLLGLAQRAGLPVSLADLVDEPVAAGIAWLASRSPDQAIEPMRVVVFDMGGGTLDIAVLDVRGVDHRQVSVLAAIGVAEAGDALDEAIAEDLDFALAAAGVDVDSLSRPDRARGRLRDEARKAKIALSEETSTPLALSPRIFGKVSLWYSRDQLEGVFSAQMDRAEQYVAAALQAAWLTEAVSANVHDIVRTPIDELTADVTHVVLSGGMSQIPYVAARMKDLFGPATVVEPAAGSPIDAVVLGLSRAAGYGRINMYRPSFDIVLEWDRGRQRRVVYEAYSPLFASWQIVHDDGDLGHTRTGGDLSLPRRGRGRLRVVSHSGARVRATLGGRDLDGFPVAVSEQAFSFTIACNGRLWMTDDSGRYQGRIDDWFTAHDQTLADRLGQTRR